MFKKFLSFIVILHAVASTTSDVVPVLIWEEEKELSSNDLRWSEDVNKHLTSGQFGNIVNKHLSGKSNILVFLQDKISVEDFSTYSDASSPFASVKHGMQSNPSVYLPRVSDPVKGMSKLEEHFKVHHELADNESEIMKHLAEEGSTMVYVHLPKTTEKSREKALLKNDEMITSIVDHALFAVDELVVIFTGEKSATEDKGESHSTSRRLLAATEEPAAPKEPSAPAVDDTGAVSYQDNCTILYIGNVSVVLNGTKEYFSDAQVSSRCENASETSITIKWTGTPEGDVDLVMKFKGGSKRDWKVTSLKMTTTGKNGMGSVNTYKTKGLYAPRGFSYLCGGTNYFRPMGNSSLKLCLDDFRVQPLFGVGADGFGRTYDCVGFFSAPILAGIMVTLMFAIVLYWALSMVMGIQTMDQFDDPKGPSISVPQSD